MVFQSYEQSLFLREMCLLESFVSLLYIDCPAELRHRDPVRSSAT